MQEKEQRYYNVIEQCLTFKSYTLFLLPESGVIDHVPVDDNPAYITMKRITLNKNTAYETTTVATGDNENIFTSDYEIVS